MADASDPQFLTGEETGLTRLACPECGGGLAETVLPTITYYRCHIGHQYAPQTLAAAQAEAVERKLWTAIAALEEQAVVLRHLATQHPDQAAADLARAKHRGPGPAADPAGRVAARPGRNGRLLIGCRPSRSRQH